MTSTPKGKKKREDKMDGAMYPFHTNKIPADFMSGPDGLRPGQDKEPWGYVLIDLTDGIGGNVIPPRFIWEEGDWKAKSPSDRDGDVWVVSGEATPGNYAKREYKLPEDIVSNAEAPHPADWKRELKEKKKPKTSSSSSSYGLPYGLRVRCLGCGHFFKMNDLTEHAKNACPAVQDPVLWIIECECHKDLLVTAEVLPGFPMKPPEKPAEAKPAETTGPTEMASPDMSGALGDKVKEKAHEAGRSTKPAGEAGATTERPSEAHSR